MANVLIVSGSPDTSSFSHALANAYYEGAQASGIKASMLVLGELHFDPILHNGYKEIQQLEPDLLSAQTLIEAASHIVFVYPSWWGSMPALLKGFFDRTFHPGFAFKAHKKDPFWDKYLTGKTARIIITMDSPSLWNRFVYHRSNIHSVKEATLEYCGIKPVRITSFDKVKFSTIEQRQRWLKQVEHLGKQMK